MKTVDARGCSCPQPVLMTKNAISQEQEIQVLVDNNTARQNIERFANSQKLTFKAEGPDANGEYVLTISK